MLGGYSHINFVAQIVSLQSFIKSSQLDWKRKTLSLRAYREDGMRYHCHRNIENIMHFRGWRCDSEILPMFVHRRDEESIELHFVTCSYLRNSKISKVPLIY